MYCSLKRISLPAGLVDTMNSQIASQYIVLTLHRPQSPCHSKLRRSIRNFVHYPFYVWYCIRSIMITYLHMLESNHQFIHKHSQIVVMTRNDGDGWLYGKSGDQEGLFPENYVTKIATLQTNFSSLLVSHCFFFMTGLFNSNVLYDVLQQSLHYIVYTDFEHLFGCKGPNILFFIFKSGSFYDFSY